MPVFPLIQFSTFVNSCTRTLSPRFILCPPCTQAHSIPTTLVWRERRTGSPNLVSLLLTESDELKALVELVVMAYHCSKSDATPPVRGQTSIRLPLLC